MKNFKRTFLTLILFALTTTLFAQKIKTTKSHVSFFSTTAVEDITADNYKTVGTLDQASGAIVFVVPMQSFEFEKALMQKHFNSSKFLDTKTNPKGKLVGKITNLDAVDFSKDGEYPVMVAGKMTINGETNDVNEKAMITVTGGKIAINSKFNLTLADYKVAFEKGKASSSIAETIEIKIDAEY